MGRYALYSVQPQSNNTITFRKIRTGKKPQSIDIALTQASTPLFLLQYTSALELYSLTTVGEERIDKLPPKSVTIPTQSAESPWNHATFLVSEQSGLHIAAVGGKDATHTIYTLVSQVMLLNRTRSRSIPMFKRFIPLAYQMSNHLQCYNPTTKCIIGQSNLE